MDKRKSRKLCQMCEQHSDTVLDGICETCEPIWLHQIGIMSRQLDANTSLSDLFEQAAKAAKEKISNTKKELTTTS